VSAPGTTWVPLALVVGLWAAVSTVKLRARRAAPGQMLGLVLSETAWWATVVATGAHNLTIPVVAAAAIGGVWLWPEFSGWTAIHRVKGTLISIGLGFTVWLAILGPLRSSPEIAGTLNGIAVAGAACVMSVALATAHRQEDRALERQ